MQDPESAAAHHRAVSSSDSDHQTLPAPAEAAATILRPQQGPSDRVNHSDGRRESSSVRMFGSGN
jgi:hypothetical protein